MTRWGGTFPWGRGCHECRGLTHSGATHTTERRGRGLQGRGRGLDWEGSRQVAQARGARGQCMVSELQPRAGALISLLPSPQGP